MGASPQRGLFRCITFYSKDFCLPYELLHLKFSVAVLKSRKTAAGRSLGTCPFGETTRSDTFSLRDACFSSEIIADNITGV